MHKDQIWMAAMGIVARFATPEFETARMLEDCMSHLRHDHELNCDDPGCQSCQPSSSALDAHWLERAVYTLSNALSLGKHERMDLLNPSVMREALTSRMRWWLWATMWAKGAQDE